MKPILLDQPEYVHPLLRREAEFQEACRSGRLKPRELLERYGKLPPIEGGSTPGSGYTVTWTAQTLTSATARTMVGLATGANTPLQLVEFSLSGDATSGTLLIELVYGTNATNPPGTNSVSFTPLQMRGPVQTMVSTAAVAWTAGNEPTVLTALKRWRFPWPGGPFTLQSPLGREANSIPTTATSGKFIGFRLTSSQAVSNCDGYLEFEEG